MYENVLAHRTSYIKWKCQDIQVQCCHTSPNSGTLSHHLLLQRNTSPMPMLEKPRWEVQVSKVPLLELWWCIYNKWDDSSPPMWLSTSLMTLELLQWLRILTWPLSFYMTLEISRDSSYSMWDPWFSTYFTFSHFGKLHNYIPQMMRQDTLTHVTLEMTIDNDDMEFHDDVALPSCSSCCFLDIFMMDLACVSSSSSRGMIDMESSCDLSLWSFAIS